VKVSAVIPAFNEADRIAGTISALCSIREIDEIIVVDDGSGDDTATRAKEAGAGLVVVLPENRGKGEALARGAAAASGDVLCFVDADLGSSASEFARLLVPVLQGEADMVVAAWPNTKKKAGFGLVKGMARTGIRMLTGFRPQSPLSGQRVLRREVWEDGCLKRSGFGVEVGLTVNCLRKGYRLLEVPVEMRHRESGRSFSGFMHRGRQFVQVVSMLWQLWRRKVRL
jgi:glycosyltransferase involved in cell wall biosynthesis